MLRYESYKSSGLKWLGDLPAHWKVRPGFTCFQENKDRNKGLVESTVLSLSYGRIVIKPEEKLTGLVPESFESYQLIKPGDIVIRTTDLQNDQTSLRVGYAKDKGMITSAYLGLRCHPEINPAYVFRLLESYDALKVFYGMGSGLRQNIDFWDFKRLPIPLPPRDEQDRIVAFLDQKTTEIDAAIAKKERLIELLQEQKKAAIRRAVTQGIRGNHSLIPHDLSYLKQVPSNWKIKRNKQLFFEKKSVVGKQASSYTLLSLTLNGVIPRDLENPKGKFPAEFDTYKKVQPNDMVFCLFDVEETPRTVGLSKHVGMITGAYTVVECFDTSLAGYLSYFYTALDDEKMLRPFYTGLRNVIQRNTFFGLQVPIPPEAERQEIVEYIDSIIRETAQLTEKMKQEVNSLQKFKNVLVASAVKGRVKV